MVYITTKQSAPQAKWSFIAYLNEGFEGGNTTFFSAKGNQVSVAVTPEKGMKTTSVYVLISFRDGSYLLSQTVAWRICGNWGTQIRASKWCVVWGPTARTTPKRLGTNLFYPMIVVALMVLILPRRCIYWKPIKDCSSLPVASSVIVNRDSLSCTFHQMINSSRTTHSASVGDVPSLNVQWWTSDLHISHQYHRMPASHSWWWNSLNFYFFGIPELLKSQ